MANDRIERERRWLFLARTVFCATCSYSGSGMMPDETWDCELHGVSCRRDRCGDYDADYTLFLALAEDTIADETALTPVEGGGDGLRDKR